MKKTLLLTFAIILMVTMLAVLAISTSAETVGGEWGDLDWTLDTETGALSITGDGDMKDLSSSNDAWRAYSSSIKSVNIGNGVTSIGDYAFYYTNLTTINIPNSVTNIGESVFSTSTKLSSVTIGSNVVSIGDFAFNHCRSLTNITIPYNVTSIGESAFNGCTTLTDITVDSKNTYYKSIDGNLYSKDGKTLIQYAIGKSETSFDIPLSVENFGVRAFSGCTSLKNITIGNSVTSIGKSAFEECTGLKKVIIGESVKDIGYHAFYKCTGLTDVTIGNNVTSIGDYAFYSICGLTNITIPNSVTSIGDFAFYSSGLTSINIPSSVTSIGSAAFSGLISITVDSNNKIYHSCGNCIIETASKTLVLGCNTSVIPNDGSVIRIGDYAFYQMNFPSINIPSGVTSIGKYAFYKCTELTSITIPDSVTSIGGSAFNGCTNLKIVFVDSADIASSLTASDSCGNLISNAEVVLIKKGIEIVGSYVTSNYTFVEEISYVGTEYTSYSKHAHVWTEHDEDFDKCSACGLLKDRSEPENTVGGKWGNLSWTLNLDTGELSITGEGEMNDFSSTSTDAWRAYKDSIKTVNIGNGVTNIGKYVFYKCAGLTSVTIGNGVTSIGDGAFRDCTGLTSIDIPNNVTSIGGGAFFGCAKLASVTIGNNVTSIGNGAFQCCYGLTSVTIPNSVKSIDDGAFAYCLTLREVTIPDSVTSIGTYVFTYCTALKSITVDSNNKMYHSNGNCLIETASKTLIAGCKTSVIPTDGSVASIGEAAFSYCTGLMSVTIPNSVTSIGEDAFSGCSGLTSITIGNSVKNIENSAFYGCWGLASIYIPNSVTSIGNNAFQGCTGLKSITIPNSITTIGKNAFYNCSNLKIVFVDSADIASSLTSSTSCGCLIENAEVVLIKKGIETVGSYVTTNYTFVEEISYEGTAYTSYSKHAHVWEACNGDPEDFVGCECSVCGLLKGSTKMANEVNGTWGNLSWTFNLDTGELSITGEGEMDNFGSYSSSTDAWRAYKDSIKSVNIGNGVTSIGDGAFYECTGLTSVTIPNNVTSIGGGAFQGTAYYYNSSNWKDGVLYIGNHLIEAKYTLSESYEIKNGTKTIADYAFWFCTGLTSVNIPNSVTSIGAHAFEGCTGLTSVTIGNGVKSIGNSAFNNCTELTSATIGNGVTSIGDLAFYGCTGLTSIIIPDSVTSIGDHAFENCNKLTSITVDPNNETYHSNGNCIIETSSKTLVVGCKTSVIPSDGTVINIGSSAFARCTGLTSVTIPNSITSIGGSAFNGCANLKIVFVDSANIASKLTSSTSCGYLISNAEVVLIKKGIETVGSYVTTNYTFVEEISCKGTDYTSYSKHAHVWEACNGEPEGFVGYKCSVCGILKSFTGNLEAEITHASLSLCSDLTMKFYVSVTEGAPISKGDLILKVIIGEKTTVIEDFTTVNGKYVFAFKGITPERMSELMDIELYFMGEKADEVLDYSVKQNAQALLTQYANDEKLVRLITDMLHYGAAAQKYRGYMIHDLATDGVSGMMSELDPIFGKSDKNIVSENAVDDVYFTQVGVRFENVNKLYVKLSSYEGAKIIVKLDGKVVATYDDITSDTVYTGAIFASNFNKVYTFELYDNDVLVQTLTYSISSYCNSMQTSANPNTRELTRTLYNYGCSAAAYLKG